MTIIGIRIDQPESVGLPQRRPIGDGTVPAKSVYDLEGLSNDGELNPNGTYTIDVENVRHTELPTDPGVLDKVIEIINAP